MIQRNRAAGLTIDCNRENVSSEMLRTDEDRVWQHVLSRAAQLGRCLCDLFRCTLASIIDRIRLDSAKKAL